MDRSRELLAVSFLIFAVVLTVWLGIAGPVDFTKLKDWQPLIAAVIALSAAGLAYHAAIAKVELDRQARQEDAKRRQMSIYLRLGPGLENAIKSAHQMRASVSEKQTSFEGSILHWVIRMPPEIEEAWTNVDLFPRSQARDVAEVLRAFKNLHALFGDIERSFQLDLTLQTDMTRRLTGHLRDTAQTIIEVSERLLLWLEHETQANE